MLWGKKVLQVAAVLAVAVGAAHTAEQLQAPAAQHSLLRTAADAARDPRAGSVQPQNPAVPDSASLSSPADPGLGQVTGITAVAAAAPRLAGDGCQAQLSLATLPGAMIKASLAAPCNRGERFVVRHSGLSFTAQTRPDGLATVILPALRADAMVAVYLQDSRLVLGRVTVPDAASYARFAISWDSPVEIELRVTDGDRVLIGSAAMSGLEQGVLALGQGNLPSPVMARVYSVPGKDLGLADITGELRITPATCGRTLRVETAHSSGGVASISEQIIAVPLCGTAGDILVLKNLAPALKLAAPK